MTGFTLVQSLRNNLFVVYINISLAVNLLKANHDAVLRHYRSEYPNEGSVELFSEK